MHIAFAASECVPYSKTGGLADVVGALPRALAALGHQVTVYLPRYRQTKLADPQTVVRSVTIPFDDHYRFCSVVSAGGQAGVRYFFVEYPPFFDREALYGTRGRRLSRQRRALRLVLARRARGVENSRRSGCFSLSRLAVRADPGLVAYAVRRGSRLPRQPRPYSRSTTWAIRDCSRRKFFPC